MLCVSFLWYDGEVNDCLAEYEGYAWGLLERSPQTPKNFWVKGLNVEANFAYSPNFIFRPCGAPSPQQIQGERKRLSTLFLPLIQAIWAVLGDHEHRGRPCLAEDADFRVCVGVGTLLSRPRKAWFAQR